MNVQVTCILIASIAAGMANEARANDADTSAGASFSLRFPAALARFSSYADVAGFGGASAGSRYASSVNPAATDWQPPPGTPYSLSPQVSRIAFDTGPDLTITTVAGGASVAGLGGVQPAYARIRNNGSETGDFLLMEGQAGQLQWGRKLTDSVALGVNINTSRFDSKLGLSSTVLASSRSKSDGVRVGVLWAISGQLLAGLVADRNRGRADTDAFDPSCGCAVAFTEHSRSNSLRAGLSYEYAEQSAVYLDGLSARYRGEGERLTSRIVFAGIEHRVLPWLFARAGLAHGNVAGRGHTSHTLGLGLAPSRHWSLDLAYQRDMFPELHPEFGKSRLLNLSVGVVW